MAGRSLATLKRDLDARDLVVAELEIADATPVVAVGIGTAALARDELVRDDARLTLGEDPGLGSSDARHIADRVDAGEARLERQRVDRNPTVDAEIRLPHDRGRAVHGNPEEEVVGHLPAVGE